VTASGPGITVITTPGNTYVIATGVTAPSEVTITGELAIEVLDASGNWLARFGSVETVYLTGAVTVPAARGL